MLDLSHLSQRLVTWWRASPIPRAIPPIRRPRQPYSLASLPALVARLVPHVSPPRVIQPARLAPAPPPPALPTRAPHPVPAPNLGGFASPTARP
jgi:hypothetical protein